MYVKFLLLDITLTLYKDNNSILLMFKRLTNPITNSNTQYCTCKFRSLTTVPMISIWAQTDVTYYQ